MAIRTKILFPVNPAKSLPLLTASLISRFASSATAQHQPNREDVVYVKAPTSDPNLKVTPPSGSVTFPISCISGSIVGKRFYKKVTTREADDGNGWTVMLDYRTLKTPSKRPLKLPNLAMAMAIAAEWQYQEADGIRPFTMPLMKLACTAIERVPLTRPRIIEHLIREFNQDLVFCRMPEDNPFNTEVHAMQVEKLDPLLDWAQSEFGHKPVVHTGIFGGKQEEGLARAAERVLNETNDYELAAIDALASAAHSLVIALAIFRGKLGIEGSIDLIRIEENIQMDEWGLVEGGHDIDVADLKVQISSAVVFLQLAKF